MTGRASKKKPPRAYGTGTVEKRGEKWRAMLDVSLPDEPVRRRSTKTFATKTEAEQWIKVQAGMRASGVKAAAPASKEQTVKQYLASWLDGPYVTNNVLTESTQRQYRQVTESYLMPILGRRKLTSLTPKTISAALAELAKPGAVPSVKPGRTRTNNSLSPNTVALARRTLRAALTCAVRDGELTTNPARESQLPYRKGTIRPRPDPLSDAEMVALQKVWVEHRIRPIVQFALSTGMRLGELVALKTGDLSDDGFITVNRNSTRGHKGYTLVQGTKTGANGGRRLALTERGAEALKLERVAQAAERLKIGTVWHDDGMVFASPIGTPLGHRNIQRQWHELCDAANIKRRRFHTLRHSAATWLFAGGIPLEGVSKILGHSTTAVTGSTYAAVLDSMTSPAAAAIDEAFRRTSVR